jgi:hypothetical protein
MTPFEVRGHLQFLQNCISTFERHALADQLAFAQACLKEGFGDGMLGHMCEHPCPPRSEHPPNYDGRILHLGEEEDMVMTDVGPEGESETPPSYEYATSSECVAD